jgi:hypothetical protein
MIRKVFSIQALLWLALVLALAGSLRHVAWGFSTLEQGDLYAGYGQAVAVDIGMFGLAVGIQQRRRQGRRSAGLWGGVLLFSGVSTYANLLHGLAFSSDIGLTDWPWLVFLRPFILSAVLPILVVYLSEVAAADVNYGVEQEQKERRAAERRLSRELSSTEGFNTFPADIEHARLLKAEQDALTKAQRLDRMLEIYRTNPHTKITQVASAVGLSRTTVYAYLNTLEQTGRIRRNGQGVEVL